MGNWRSRPKVKKCEHHEECDCPFCSNVHCDHWEGSGECLEEDCPLFVNGRWLKDTDV